MAPLPSTALIVLVMATLSHPGGRCQSPPSVTSDPPFETPPPPTTVPPGCRLEDGTEVEGLLPGDSRQTGCEYCECDQQGLVVCAYADCIMPPCVDPVKGDCCSTCPNGSNCRTPSGQIIGDGETVTEGDMICTCSTQDYFIFDDGTQEGDGPQATCIPRSTTTTTSTTTTPTTVPPGCRLQDGTEVEGLLPGDSRQTGCEYCECDQQGLVVCAYADCIMPPCVDPVEGDCCSTCPNGSNCRTPSGQIIGDGETVTEGDMICTCSTQDYVIWDDGTQEGDGPQATCIPRSTTTTTTTTTTAATTSSPLPPACRLDNGTVMKGLHPQGRWRSADGCRSCYCEVSGRAYCNVTECSAPACERPVPTPGVCCLGCPDQGADNQPDPGTDGLDGNTGDNAGAALPPLGHSLCLTLACTLWQLLPFYKFVFNVLVSSETVCTVADIER